MTELLGIARLKIHEGKLEELKRLSALCREVVRTKDTGTLQYDLYLSDDGTEAVVIERYRDSDALLEHSANLGELNKAMFETCTAEGELLGTPSATLRAALEGTPVRVLGLYQSMTPAEPGR